MVGGTNCLTLSVHNVAQLPVCLNYAKSHPPHVDPENSVRGRGGPNNVCFFSPQRIPNCFSRGLVPVFLTKHKATCAVPGGGSPDRGPCPSLDLRMSPLLRHI